MLNCKEGGIETVDDERKYEIYQRLCYEKPYVKNIHRPICIFVSPSAEAQNRFSGTKRPTRRIATIAVKPFRQSGLSRRGFP
jgi:hypothetical protein